MKEQPLAAGIDLQALCRSDPLMADLARRARLLDGRLLLIGGAPRDLMRGRAPRDLDFILAARDEESAALLDHMSAAHGARRLAFDRKGVRERRLVITPRELDFILVRPHQLEAEFARRDFTINAMAVDLRTGSLLDPYAGRRDLQMGLLRQLSPASLAEDPLRGLRAVRLLCDGVVHRVESATRTSLCRTAPLLSQVAGERIAMEWVRIIDSQRMALGLNLMWRWGQMPTVCPEAMPLSQVSQNRFHHLDCRHHTLVATAMTDRPAGLAQQLMEPGLPPLPPLQGEDRLVLKLAAFAHDWGKPSTRHADENGQVHFYGHEKVSAALWETAAARWHFPRQRVARVKALVREHLRPGALGPQATLRACRRLIHAAGSDLDLLLLLTLADSNATRGHGWQKRHEDLIRTCRRLRRLACEAGEALRHPPRLLDGHQIMALTGLSPGPRLGAFIQALHQLQVSGDVSTLEQARAAVVRFLEHGLPGEGQSDTDAAE